MTIEELKKEAEESFEKYRVTDIDYVVSPYSEDEGEKILMFNNEYDAEEEYFRLYSKGYLASAEPREKRIAELEKENVELKIKKIPELERKIASIRGCHRVDLVKLKARTEQVARLKKEKAELEQENLVLHKMNVKRIEYYNQLTKAKEIITVFLKYSEYDEFEQKEFDEYFDNKNKAEQFLKDSGDK